MHAAPRSDDTMVVALGGNAIVRRGERGTIDEQFAHAREALSPLVRLVADGKRLVITHGNGPVVGNIVERGEAARGHIPPMPLYIADADSQGGLGVMLQMTMRNLLVAAGAPHPVVTLVTQVVVDRADPAFSHPSKPIGPWYDAEGARRLARAEGWTVRELNGRGWRRVVPSPPPLEIVEAASVAHLAASGHVVIAGGGGGVPVERTADGSLKGVDAVVDKDATAALLATSLGADALVILMEADAVYEGWGTPAQHRLERLTAAEIDEMLASGAFESGSMSPKLQAAASFARSSERDAVICSPAVLDGALAGAAGTRVVAS